MSAFSSAPGAQQRRFAAYLDSLAQAAEHADRVEPPSGVTQNRPMKVT